MCVFSHKWEKRWCVLEHELMSLIMYKEEAAVFHQEPPVGAFGALASGMARAIAWHWCAGEVNLQMMKKVDILDKKAGRRFGVFRLQPLLLAPLCGLDALQL